MNEIEYKQWQRRLLNEINYILTSYGSLLQSERQQYSWCDYSPEEFIPISQLKLYQTIKFDTGSTPNQDNS